MRCGTPCRRPEPPTRVGCRLLSSHGLRAPPRGPARRPGRPRTPGPAGHRRRRRRRPGRPHGRRDQPRDPRPWTRVASSHGVARPRSKAVPERMPGMSGLLAGLLSAPPAVVYMLVGLLVFGEAAVFIGFVLPGETAVVLGGVLASRHEVDLLPLVALVA